mmetsp:Transcript_25363/g.80257  ORF Transcript_25363/g.80257 Transcript_25363/m.80257 type:complete len:409 (+) Transcript_25363:206-1432(+)
MHLLHAAAAAAGEHERDGRADEHTDHDRDDDQHQVAAAAATRRWGGGRSRRRGVDGGRERGRSEGRRRGQGRGGRRGGRRRGLGGLRVKHNVGVEVGDGDRGLAVGGGGLVAALLLEVGRTRGIVGPVPHAHTDDEALRRSRGREDKRARSGQRRAVLRSEDTDHAREDVGVLGDGDGASRSLGVVGDRHVEIPRVRTDGHTHAADLRVDLRVAGHLLVVDSVAGGERIDGGGVAGKLLPADQDAQVLEGIQLLHRNASPLLRGNAAARTVQVDLVHDRVGAVYDAGVLVSTGGGSNVNSAAERVGHSVTDDAARGAEVIGSIVAVRRKLGKEAGDSAGLERDEAGGGSILLVQDALLRDHHLQDLLVRGLDSATSALHRTAVILAEYGRRKESSTRIELGHEGIELV